MRQNKWFRRAAGLTLACASIVSAAPLGGSVAPVVSAQAAIDAGGEFHALTPTRILDTRSPSINDVAPLGAKASVPNPTTSSAGEFDFAPLAVGLEGLPTDADDVLAIVANVTVTQPGQGGWVAVYPKGFEFGGADGNGQVSSLVNFEANTSVPNMAVVGLGDDGMITINGFSNPGSSYHILIDILGFISTSSHDEGGARLEVVAPGRLLDTRTTSAIGPGQSRNLPMRGADTVADATGTAVTKDIVPDDEDVTAVLINLTLVNDGPGAQLTHATATPDKLSANAGGSTPSTSNATPGLIKANTTIVPINDDGSISLYNNSGNLHLVVDVLGYFEEGADPGTNRGRVVPLDAPFRAFDTREAAFNDTQLQHGSEETWSFDDFVNSVVLNPGADNQVEGPPQQALIGNLTAVELEPLFPSQAGTVQSSFLKLTPADAEPAEVSNVNFFLGDVVPNTSLVKYGVGFDKEGTKTGDHVVKAYNNYGQIDYLLDVFAIVLDD